MKSSPSRKKHRVVQGLVRAEACSSPWPIMPKPRGTKAQGLRYQRACAKAIGECYPDRWFKFVDANGEGYCSPDILLPWQGFTVILECKLTDIREAHEQLVELYSPVIEHVYKRPTALVIVARHLTQKPPLVAETLPRALELAAQGQVPTLHWLGRTLLAPS